MQTILIIEDDTNINNMLKIILQNHYKVKQAYSGTEALLVHSEAIDLIILDLMLPGKSGEEIIKKLKEIKNVPVIVTSAIHDIDKKLTLFNLGADDYVTKPFNNDELLARIKVHINKAPSHKPTLLTFKDLKINTKTYTATIKDKALNLSKTEFEILKLLVQNQGKVVTKSSIFNAVWDDENSADENTLNVHISKIRTKIKHYTSEPYIETIWSIGYKLKD